MFKFLKVEATESSLKLFGLLNVPEEGDAVLFDKGLLISDILSFKEVLHI